MSVTLTVAMCATLFAGPQQAGQGGSTTPSRSGTLAAANSSTSFTRVYATDTPGLVLPVATQQPRPQYSPEAQRAKVQGSIELEITVGLDGLVRDAMVVKSLDTLYGMDDSAVATVSKWVFEPAKLDGKTVSARTRVTFTNTYR
jgi:protein TonB